MTRSSSDNGVGVAVALGVAMAVNVGVRMAVNLTVLCSFVVYLTWQVAPTHLLEPMSTPIYNRFAVLN